jgi:alanine racemase
VGIAMYGLWPSSETRLSARAVLGKVPELRPVLSWHCKSQLVKWLPEGSYVGYGCTYRCPSRTRIAVLPIGYFDGYPRIASGKAYALVNGQRCPFLGRVMMNHIVLDVTRAAPESSEVIATLIGRDGEEHISADQLAAWAQTINYEIVTRLGSHLRREVIA